MSLKKDAEKAVFENALRIARARGGVSRRNVDRINGEYVERVEEERPDFLLERNRAQQKELVCIEHFRVDQMCEQNTKGGHMDSLSARGEARGKAIRGKWLPCIERGETPDVFLCETGDWLADNLEAWRKTTYANYLLSFIQAFDQHLLKVDEYARNVCRYRQGHVSVKTAFLIELHSDFSHCGFNAWGNSVKLEPGFLILFWDMIERLEEAASRVDYIVFASCTPWSREVVDAVALNIRKLKTELAKAGVPIANYYGENRFYSTVREYEMGAKTKKRDDEIEFSFWESGQVMSIESKVSLCYEELPKALAERRANGIFVCSSLLQYMVGAFYDCDFGRNMHPQVVSDKIGRHIQRVGLAEIEARLDKSLKKWVDGDTLRKRGMI